MVKKTNKIEDVELDKFQEELVKLRDAWYDLTGERRGFYNSIAEKLKCSPNTISTLTSPSKSQRRMETKKDAVKVAKQIISHLKRNVSVEVGIKEEAKPMKQQEKTVQGGINTFASNLAKAVIKQMDVNELNAEIADAFTVVTNLKTSLSVAEKQLNTVKTVKDMLSKGDLTEADIVLLTQYVDSMAGN